MKLYADLPVRRALQVTGDLLFLGWIVLWVAWGNAIHDAVLKLGVPGRRVDQASSALAAQLRDAASSAEDIPLVGSGVARPIDGAGDAADQLAAAGRAQVEAVGDLAVWLGLAVAVIPILVVLAVYLPLRIRFVRRATAGRRLLDSEADLDLFALRAMTNQPLHVLARISDDPVGALRSGDRPVIRRLAELELGDVGMRA